VTPPPLPYAPGPAPEPPKKGLPSGASGRPPGAANKVTRALKEAILLAGEKAGDAIAEAAAGRGETRDGGLAGYLYEVALNDSKTFCGLLGRVLPLQVTGEGGGPLTVTFKTVYEDAPLKVVNHGA